VDVATINRQVIEQFRASGGVGAVGPVHLDRVVLLTTTGRRTGQPRTVPLGFALDADGHLLLFASNMGAPRDPEWFRNLAADPRVHVEITGAEWDARAEILSGAERDDAYRRWVEMAPNVADHQEKAGRIIPMVRIRRPS
jgi:deazaflavin-dependent oxidoreductase (nitroreductase family)